MCPTWPRALLGLRSGAGGNAGIGERLRLSGRWGRARSRFFFARERRADAAKERIRLPFRRMVTKRTTRALGCRCGWTTSMRSTGNALRLDWMSLFPLRTCRGMFARCTLDTRMGTWFDPAKGLGTGDSGDREAEGKAV